MDREKLQSFITTAEGDLAFVRSSLLIVAQTGDASDLAIPRRHLERLAAEASENGLARVAEISGECIVAVENLSATINHPPNAAYAALDIVARIEASVWDMPLQSGEFLSDVAAFVDASFEEFLPHFEIPDESTLFREEFEIDEETLDIFRSEAEELIANITNNVAALSISPGDQHALWDIRRNAHTFKGAAGIIGLKDASAIAHRMEDLLDTMVEMRRDAVPKVVEFLKESAVRLNEIVAAKNIDGSNSELETRYADIMLWLSSPVEAIGVFSTNGDDVPDSPVQPRVDPVKTTTSPIVRVSLDRLDKLIKISRGLAINRLVLAERFAEFTSGTHDDGKSLAQIEALFETGRHLTDEIQAKLLSIRMVKFGNLATRLSRAVHVTCLDEGKKADVEIENGDVEIDTQIIDALIEPLLHLLKNAVVHGIESPDTRRLIGKPERGSIRISIEADDEALIMSVSDDGSGIPAPKLKEKAIASGIVTAENAALMNDREAMKLIFDRGLTTADKIDLNAGRGVGMSIVKESVESRGGKVLVQSEPRRGTTFTILMPLAVAKTEPPEPVVTKVKSDKPLPPLILVVDDSAGIRRQTTKLVEAEGLRVITANNGAEALELLLSGEWEPDLILSDIEMPQVDGWEFLEYVKTDENFGHIPVVIVTSLTADQHRQRALDLGAADYLVKPFSGKDLERVLEKLGKAAAV